MSHLNINGVDKPLDHVYVKARTENLFDASTLANDLHLSPSTGFPSSYSGRIATTTTIDVSAYTELTLTFSIQIASGTLAFMYSKFYNGSLVERVAGFESGSTIDVSDADSLYIAFYVGRRNITTDDVNWVMLNSGSTALPYQPYLITKEAWEAKSRVILHNLTNPLCGIGTYKDTLDLSTGTLTRYVKKLVLTGEEPGWGASTQTGGMRRRVFLGNGATNLANSFYVSSHFSVNTPNTAYPDIDKMSINSSGSIIFGVSLDETVEAFKQWIKDQYSAGHPVTIWYILATPETEQITLPSNLTGIVEGYLTQTGTPTPTNPIYPTANGTPEQGGTYSLDTGAYAIAWGRADTFTGTNSISARCYGLPVKSWEIDGNSQQSGVPAPDDPIDPDFVGERTGNLFDDDNAEFGKWVNSNGSIATNAAYAAGYDIKVGTASEFAIKYYGDKPYSYSMAFYDNNGDFLSRVHRSNPSASYDTFTVPENAVSARFQVAIDTIATMTRKILKTMKLMLNTGTEPLQYEPYGYKLPITSAGQTAPVYLGEVPTVRKIRKLVLTGDENWTYYFTANYNTVFTTLSYRGKDSDIVSAYVMCSHYRGLYSNVNEMCRILGNGQQLRFYDDTRAANVTTWKSYLATQYAAGNPVTVWYVLAEPKTGIVNEPLCKIGEYADTLNSADAGITIPTTDGNNTISVDTSLAPSRFEIKVHAKPITKPIHYGFKIDKSISDPSNAVIYTHDAVTMTPAGMDFANGVFDYGSWENVWFIKNARPIMLNFDGTEAYDLDPNDYSKKLDGTPSDIADSTKTMNAMIAFPTVWIKRTDDGSYNYIEISDRQLDSDFHAYAHEDANGVVKPYIYLPIYKGSLVDGKLRSISGVKPQSDTTAQQEVDAASALGTGWQIWDYTSKEMLCDLLTLISKSLDTQGKFGQGHSTGGGSASYFLDCGTLNNKGKFFGYSATTSQVKCFGMEAMWAERWDRELGLILDAGIYKIKEHPAYNLTGEGYIAISTSVAKCPTSNNYIKAEVSTQFGGLPTVVGGTESTYYCDYFYQDQSGIRVAFRGGNCSRGARAGLRCVDVDYSTSGSGWYLGASPVYK